MKKKEELKQVSFWQTYNGHSYIGLASFWTQDQPRSSWVLKQSQPIKMYLCDSGLILKDLDSITQWLGLDLHWISEKSWSCLSLNVSMPCVHLSMSLSWRRLGRDIWTSQGLDSVFVMTVSTTQSPDFARILVSSQSLSWHCFNCPRVKSEEMFLPC